MVFFVLCIIFKNVCESFNGRSYITFQSNYQIYLLTAIGLTPGGSSTVHISTSYTVAFALQLRKKHGKTSGRVAEECQLAR